MKRSKKERNICLAILTAVLLVTGCGGAQAQGGLWADAADAAARFFTGEPKEVQELRRREFLQEEGGYEYYFRQIPEEEQRIYREILDSVRLYETDFYVTSSDNEKINHAYHALLRDHPELFWIHNREMVYTTAYSTYTRFNLMEACTQEEILAGQQQMEAVCRELYGQVAEDASDYEKVRAVYRWVILHTVYGESQQDQNLLGVFRDGQAVCAGYAGAVQYLLNEWGIPCIYIAGDSREDLSLDTGHAWNAVLLEDSWYYLDATNGDQPEFFQDREGEARIADMVLYDFLCPFPKEYESLCVADGEFEIPQCVAVDRNDAIWKGEYFTEYSFENVYAHATHRLSDGEQILHLKFADQQVFQEGCEDLLENGRIQEIASYYLEITGLGQVNYQYGLLEEFHTLYIIF